MNEPARIWEPDPTAEDFADEMDVKAPLASVIGRACGVFFEQIRQLRERRASKFSEADCLRELDGYLRMWAYPAERYAFAVGAVWGLPRAEMCMVLDDLIETLEPMKPTPGWGDLQAEAFAWAQSVPQNVLRAYIYAAWSEYEDKRRKDFLKHGWGELTAEEQKAALKWFSENKKEAEKAEARAG